MLRAARRLLLGLSLIAAASAVLVLGDRSANRGGGAAGTHAKRIAIVQISSIDSMNSGRDGAMERLESAGYSRARGTTFDLFNAEGDVGTLNQIAAQVCSATPPYDLVISLSTVGTQAVMRANKIGLPQVFGLVASPPGIGIPLGPRTEDSKRPANVAGFGTLQPAEILFESMRSCAPGVRRVGCVWNPAEPNAEASVKLGRAVCAKLGIELLEANGSNVNEVASATDAVIARGIDCFWILADTNVIAAAKPVIERCGRAGVPVITNFPNMAAMGAAINYGADYHAMGVSTGAIAELVLGGCPPGDIPCENFVPISLWLNLDGFGRGWSRPAALEQRAERIYEGTGAPTERTVEQPVGPDSVLALLAARATSAATPGGAPAAHLPVLSLITYNRSPNFEECYRGFMDELPRVGLVDGKTCTVVLRDAQLDIGTLNTIVTAVAEERPDVVVPFTTPALQATIRRIRDRPVVFSLVASGVAAGAGTSNEDHLPNVTGAQVTSDVATMAAILRESLPSVKRVGTVFAPGEANSVYNRDDLANALRTAGIELISVGADRPTELPEAADGMVTQGAQAVVQISDNSSGTGFGTIVKAADRAGIPVLGFTPGAMRAGAALAVSRDFEDVGRLSARIVARVLRGEPTAKIPFSWPDRTEILVNPARMERYRVALGAERMKGARIMKETAGGKP
jgi:ABC-type uncharacterized transport system substrate-binding protein